MDDASSFGPFQTIISEMEAIEAARGEAEIPLSRQAPIHKKPAKGEEFQVRSGTVSVGSPNFVNLLNQVASIKLSRSNYIFLKNIMF